MNTIGIKDTQKRLHTLVTIHSYNLLLILAKENHTDLFKWKHSSPRKDYSPKC
jgi:hypothetical protein